MVAIGQSGARGSLRPAHARELPVLESVTAGVRQSKARGREGLGRGSRGLEQPYRLVGRSPRFQNVRDRDENFRILRELLRYFSIDLQGLICTAQSIADERVELSIYRIACILAQQLQDLGQRRLVGPSLGEHPRVFEAGIRIIGPHQQDVLEKNLGIVEDVELDADLREDSNGVDVCAVLLQILSNDLLGCAELALVDER